MFGSLKDALYLRVVVIIDLIILFGISVMSIYHYTVIDEGAALLTAVFNLLFIVFEIIILILFYRYYEVQTYENHIYAQSRYMWNYVSLFVFIYLIATGSYWAFGNTDKSELIPIIAFYYLYVIYSIVSILSFMELKDITLSVHSAKDGSIYLEGNNYLEKTKKEKFDKIRINDSTGQRRASITYSDRREDVEFMKLEEQKLGDFESQDSSFYSENENK